MTAVKPGDTVLFPSPFPTGPSHEEWVLTHVRPTSGGLNVHDLTFARKRDGSTRFQLMRPHENLWIPDVGQVQKAEKEEPKKKEKGQDWMGHPILDESTSLLQRFFAHFGSPFEYG